MLLVGGGVGLPRLVFLWPQGEAGIHHALSTEVDCPVVGGTRQQLVSGALYLAQDAPELLLGPLRALRKYGGGADLVVGRAEGGVDLRLLGLGGAVGDTDAEDGHCGLLQPLCPLALLGLSGLHVLRLGPLADLGYAPLLRLLGEVRVVAYLGNLGVSSVQYLYGVCCHVTSPFSVMSLMRPGANRNSNPIGKVAPQSQNDPHEEHDREHAGDQKRERRAPGKRALPVEDPGDEQVEKPR